MNYIIKNFINVFGLFCGYSRSLKMQKIGKYKIKRKLSEIYASSIQSTCWHFKVSWELVPCLLCFNQSEGALLCTHTHSPVQLAMKCYWMSFSTVLLLYAMSEQVLSWHLVATNLSPDEVECNEAADGDPKKDLSNFLIWGREKKLTLIWDVR